MPPLVSVILPAYNTGKYIEATLHSLHEQSFKDFEIIVVDDCSADNTVECVLSYYDARIRLIRHERNYGVAQARNTGIDASKGKFIALLDSDDLATKDRLARQVDALNRDPDLGMVGSQVGVILENGVATKRVWKRPVNESEVSQQLIFRNTLSAVMMFRRDFAPEGLFRSMTVAEDYDFNVRFAARQKVSNLDRVLTLVRVRESGLTHSEQPLMKIHVREIMRGQIEALGVRPTEYQLDLNRHVGAYTLKTTEMVLKDVENWLSILQDANQRSGRFSTSDFNRVLAMEWFAVCDFGSSIGPQAMRIWRDSKFSKIWSPNITTLARFSVKCQSRRSRPGGDVAGRII